MKDQKIRPEIHEVLGKVRERLRHAYGEKLRSIVLYGSYARGDAEEGSDIDILVVLSQFSDAAEELKQLSAIDEDLCLDYGIVLSLLPIREQDYQGRNTPFLLNVRREGISL